MEVQKQTKEVNEHRERREDLEKKPTGK